MTAAYSPGILLVLLGLAGVLALLILVALPIHYAMIHARRERELEHAERMKALELGRPFPGSNFGSDAWRNPARVAVAIGAGVPISVMIVAWLATPEGRSEIAYAIWPAAGAVGVAGVICGTVLAARLPASGRPSRGFETADAKPAADDPDAFDVVGRRG